MRQKMMMMLGLMMMAVSMNAQSINGNLVDGKNQPLAYANIVLQQMDSTFVSGQTSNEKGHFRFSKVASGDYRLVISSMGYETLYIDLQGFNRSADLGTVTVSDASQQLGEVTVTASNMVGTADRKLVFPNKKQINASANGVDLLRHLMIPRVMVNPIGNTIGTNDGGSIVLCINGRKASQNEVTALQPSEIARVEVVEDPGARYDDADIMVNYILRRYDMGGSFGYDGQQSVKSLFGSHNVNGKVNFGKSEISFLYNAGHAIFEEMWSERNEVFAFENGRTYHRNVTTDLHGQKQLEHVGQITYNLQDGNKYMLNISAGFRNLNIPNYLEEGKLFTEEYPNSVTDRRDWSHNRNTKPYVDLYFQKNLKNKQFIAFNAVGTYIDTYNRSSYQEFLNDEAVVDYSSAVKGKKYSLITEAIYEKGFSKGQKLTAGITHQQSYTNNTYLGTLENQTRMNQAYSGAYAQFRGKLGKYSYMVGMSALRVWLKQGGEDVETWRFSPRFSLSRTFNKQWNASLNGNMGTSNPSLSQLSAVDQLTDSLQIKRGNPDLIPYYIYNGSFRLNYNKGKVNVGFYTNYSHRDNPIMTHVYRENNKFVHSYANHDKFQKLSMGLNVRIGMLWDILQLSAGVSNDRYWSHGLNYNHHVNSFGIDLQAALMYKNLTLMAMYHKNADSFYGEELFTGEEMHYFGAQYRIKKVNLGLMLINPFSKEYKRTEEFRNQFAGYKYSYNIDDTACAIWATLSWNVSFGRDYKSKSKRTNNSDSDSGVM